MVNHEGRREHIGVVAVLANVCCRNVCLILARRFDTVVAVDAIADDIDVIEIRGYPAGCRMAVIAGIATRYVIRSFTSRGESIVARSAGPGHLRMIDGIYGREGIGVVAVRADVCCCYMCRILARRITAVMAATAIIDDVDVIEVRRRPAGCRMAIVTGVVCVEVSGMLAGRRRTIVAGTAGADNLCVINRQHRRKDIGRVAVFADIGGLYMRHALADRLCAIVAAGAVAADIDVIEVRGQPCDGRVAVVAVASAGDVVCALAGCRDAVVAGAAGAENLRVIDCGYGHKCHGTVTVFANIACLYVRRALARRGCAVVTTHTVTDYTGMVEDGRQPGRHGVAVVTLVI